LVVFFFCRVAFKVELSMLNGVAFQVKPDKRMYKQLAIGSF